MTTAVFRNDAEKWRFYGEFAWEIHLADWLLY